MLSLGNMSALGALLHVAGSVLIVYGQTVVKVAHCIEDSSGVGSTWLIPPMPHQPQWRRPDGGWRPQLAGSRVYATAGWSMFGLGNILRFISMRFAAQTVLSGLGSLQFVVIPLASKYLLGIQPQVSTAVGVVVVLLGNLLIIFFGPPETVFTLPQLRAQWASPAMLHLMLALGASLVSLHVFWRVIHRQRRQIEAEQRALRQRRAEAPEADPLFWAIPGSNESDLGDPSTLRMFLAALLFSAVSSFIGAWSVLFSKSLTYVVAAGADALRDGYAWFTVLAFLGTAGYWIKQSNKGLKLYPATLIMPLMQAFWMTMSVMEGMVYFDEMRTLSRTALVSLCLGLLLAIAGAVAMGLAGFFNEQPHMVAQATSPTKPPSLDLELSEADLQPLIAPTGSGAVEVTGRSGLSSPVLRGPEKTAAAAAAAAVGGATGSLRAALTAELTRVAKWRQARWGSSGWDTPTIQNGSVNGYSNGGGSLMGDDDDRKSGSSRGGTPLRDLNGAPLPLTLTPLPRTNSLTSLTKINDNTNTEIGPQSNK